MLVCVECGNQVSSLFNSYGKDNIVLEQCPKCTETADKYTEFDGVVKAIDLVLHKISVYRHILINSSLKISLQQICLFLIYLAMIEVHLHQTDMTGFYRTFRIFFSSILYNFIYSFVTWSTFRIFSKEKYQYESVRNALILGTFPQILHLLFVIWDYPRNDQFDNVINIFTFTSHFAALTAICPNSKIPLLSIVLAHLSGVQVKRIFNF